MKSAMGQNATSRGGWLLSCYYLLGLDIALYIAPWGSCGAVMAIGLKIWSLDTMLRIHLAAAPLLAFFVSFIHKSLGPTFNTVLRAAVLTALIIVLDAALVAPIFERSYVMCRSVVGNWLPFAAIFLACVHRLTGAVVATGARSRTRVADARAQRLRDLVFHFPFVLLLQWALIDAPMPKLMRRFATVIGAILATFTFTDLIVLRLPFARCIF